jgi:hypothetical protein
MISKRMLCKHLRYNIGFLKYFFSGFKIKDFYDNQVVIILSYRYGVKFAYYILKLVYQYFVY